MARAHPTALGHPAPRAPTPPEVAPPPDAARPVPEVVGAADARVLLTGPIGAELLAGRATTGGDLSLLLHPLAPRALGSPLHTHRHEDEYSFVLAGEVGVQLDDRVQVARPGDLVVKPRGIPHAFWNAGDEPARLLEVITPGGFEDYFCDLAAVLAREGGPDLDELADTAARHGIDVDPTSVTRLAQTHGLVLS